MRNYAVIAPTFWTRGSGKKLRGHKNGQLVALYLMSAPATTMIGLYHLTLPQLCHETGLSDADARDGLKKCAEPEIAIAFYDEDEELVWVPALAKHQVGEELKVGRSGRVDNKIHAIRRALAPFRHHSFYAEFMKRYGGPFKLLQEGDEAPSKELRAAAEAPPKPLPRGYDPDPASAPDLDPDPEDQDPPDRSGDTPDAATEGDGADGTRPADADDPPGESGEFEVAEPHDFQTALKVPLRRRAEFCIKKPLDGQYTTPHQWPETRKAADILGNACGLNFEIGPFPRDSGTEAVVLLFASGYTLEKLREAAERVPHDPWFKADRSRRALTSFTPKVIARLLASAPPKQPPNALTDLEAKARAQRDARDAQQAAAGQRRGASG